MNKSIRIALIAFLLALAGGVSAQADDPASGSLTVDVKGPGRVLIDGAPCLKSCLVSPADGLAVTLKAVPDPQAELVRWTGPCVGHQGECVVAPNGEIKYTTAHFRYLNDRKPVLRKLRRLSTTSLAVRVGCGGPAACSLEISGYLRKSGGRPRAAIEPVYLDLRVNEQRTVELLSGADNRPARKGIKSRAQAGGKSQLLIRVADLKTEKSSAMAINEKPACCFDKPKKPDKSNK